MLLVMKHEAQSVALVKGEMDLKTYIWGHFWPLFIEDSG